MYDMGLDWPNLRPCSLFTQRIRYVLRLEIVACTQDVN
jgi:hypothetical protein